jgi:C-terminal processing protease CtpA/Prc
MQSTYESYLTSEAKQLVEFDVDVPPGDLGLALGTCEEGVAIVATLTKFSPLTDKVKVGDRLVALDGKDISTMIATTIKRLLVSKEFNQNRRLTFARPQD